MKKVKKIAIGLRKWNRIFCTSMTCKTNIRRDGIVLSAAIILLGVFLGADRYIHNKKIQAAKVADLQTLATPYKQNTSEQVAPANQETAVSSQDSVNTPALDETKKNEAKTTVVPPKKIISETKSTDISCIKIPANIFPLLKGAPVPPDGKMKNGKLICHVLAEGHKDYPHKSNTNPKGQWGGCCYDPDEVPNPACCYPVGSVYEKYLNKYFANPFPHRK
jgi:hypothetical protein